MVNREQYTKDVWSATKMEFADFKKDSFGFSRDWAALRVSRQSLDVNLKPLKPVGDGVGGVLLHESVTQHQVVNGILMNDHFKFGIIHDSLAVHCAPHLVECVVDRNPFVACFPFVN